MYATTTHRRTLVATAVLTATWLTLAVPAADAAPKPEPQHASGRAAERCAGLEAALRDLESLTRTVDGHVYRLDGVYSAGMALTRELSARHCVAATVPW